MPASQLSAAWWKKHRALLCKDVGLEKALKDYEKVKPAFERNMSGDNYSKLTTALNALTKAAKAQAKHCQVTGHQKTKAIAEGYEDVVQDALKDAQTARLALVKTVDDCTRRLVELREDNDRLWEAVTDATELIKRIHLKMDVMQEKRAFTKTYKELKDIRSNANRHLSDLDNMPNLSKQQERVYKPLKLLARVNQKNCEEFMKKLQPYSDDH